MTRFNDDRKRREALVQGILARTSGSACDRALEHLPALGTGELDGTDRALVQGHLEHCRECRAVAVVMGWLDGELPALATVDPGEDFTAAVLARTANLPSRAAAAGHLTGPASWMDRLGQWWSERIERPLFAWQVAYALTVLLVVLTAIPGAPLRGVPGHLRTVVQAGPGQGTPLGPVFVALDSGVDQGADWVLRTVWDGSRSALDHRLTRTADARSALASDLDGAWEAFTGGRFGPALIRFSSAAGDLQDTWRLWWHNDSDSSSKSDERRPS